MINVWSWNLTEKTDDEFGCSIESDRLIDYLISMEMCYFSIKMNCASFAKWDWKFVMCVVFILCEWVSVCVCLFEKRFCSHWNLSWSFNKIRQSRKKQAKKKHRIIYIANYLWRGQFFLFFRSLFLSLSLDWWLLGFGRLIYIADTVVIVLLRCCFFFVAFSVSIYHCLPFAQNTFDRILFTFHSWYIFFCFHKQIIEMILCYLFYFDTIVCFFFLLRCILSLLIKDK